MWYTEQITFVCTEVVMITAAGIFELGYSIAKAGCVSVWHNAHDMFAVMLVCILLIMSHREQARSRSDGRTAVTPNIVPRRKCT